MLRWFHEPVMFESFSINNGREKLSEILINHKELEDLVEDVEERFDNLLEETMECKIIEGMKM